MGRPLKCAKSATSDSGFSGPAGYGVVGGNTGLSTPTIKCRVKIGTNAEADGFIVRQKGKRKFLVSDGTNTGICSLADSANSALASNTMTITATLVNSSTVRLAYLTNSHGIDFSNTHYTLTFNAAAAAPVGSAFAIASVATA